MAYYAWTGSPSPAAPPTARHPGSRARQYNFWSLQQPSTSCFSFPSQYLSIEQEGRRRHAHKPVRKAVLGRCNVWKFYWRALERGYLPTAAKAQKRFPYKWQKQSSSDCCMLLSCCPQPDSQSLSRTCCMGTLVSSLQEKCRTLLPEIHVWFGELREVYLD